MFNSAILDLAVGLVFCFLAVSLATGAITEAVATIFSWRAKTLRTGIGQLLNDPNFAGLAKELYKHAAVNPRGSGTDAAASTAQNTDPAYIDRQLFAQAMMDILNISPSAAAAQAANPALPPNVDDLKTAVNGVLASPQLRQLLHGIVERSIGDPDKIKAELAAWFDNAMDRVGGYYKRWIQLTSFVVALVLAAILNIDAITLAEALWEQPKLVDQLKLPAASSDQNKAMTASATQLLEQIDTALPVGWSARPDPLAGAFWLGVLGWLITALSTLFGAPFWFDLLQTMIRLKGSGPSPKEKASDKGAAA